MNPNGPSYSREDRDAAGRGSRNGGDDVRNSFLAMTSYNILNRYALKIHHRPCAETSVRAARRRSRDRRVDAAVSKGAGLLPRRAVYR